MRRPIEDIPQAELDALAMRLRRATARDRVIAISSDESRLILDLLAPYSSVVESVLVPQ